MIISHKHRFIFVAVPKTATHAVRKALRPHLGRDWYLLAGIPTPLTKARVADLGMILWLVKAW